VARTAGPGVRCKRRELFGFGLPGYACDGACECVAWRAPGVVHSPPSLARDAMAAYAQGRARRLHHDVLATRIGSSDKTNARFRCRKATPAGFPLPPGTPGKETQFPLCEPGDRATQLPHDHA